MMENLRTIIAKLVTVLPDDPILKALGDFSAPDWLQYLNYFVPFTLIGEITKGWCLAIVAYRVIVYCKRAGKDFFHIIETEYDPIPNPDK